ncbi:MAG TPA: beta-propeller fold lactonase family protein [Verrucomicrobiae bacterium]|nr:beta-propeller fold lactonase family protein [Verrucomicrobiae bacterium]
MKHSLFTTLCSGLALGCALLGTSSKAAEGVTIYTMDNAINGNHVLIFQQQKNGALAQTGSIETGGAGSGGGGLASQGSIQISPDGQWLFVCNAGSDEISVFQIRQNRLELSDKVSSGGQMPVSLALRDHLLYVVNSGGTVGGTDNITAFTFVNGRLSALPQSTRPVSGAFTTPTDVAFIQDGKVLVVTERDTSIIDTYAIGANGLATSHQMFESAGKTPFGFAAGRRDRIFVSEAAGVPGASSASSYDVSDTGDLTGISLTNSTMQQAACWLVLTPDEQFAYTANAGSGTLSAFNVSPNGDLSLLDFNGITGNIAAGSHPVDMAVSQNGRFLFSLANGNGTLNVFQISCDGALVYLDSLGGIATSAAGLAIHN